MLSRMLMSLLNNLHVVEKLAESRPIRRAAQITAYAITKAQIVGRDSSQRVLVPDAAAGPRGERPSARRRGRRRQATQESRRDVCQ
ncbi:LOW QUALITY PROTEIN: protein NCBP2AS2 [Phyllopteryx taeniolatus]|uniref:LOW QUALITY PROTEIN: protein NCBP2AS2 n=1 Tax=Phyllopteryx taeniolatus TaxID=161469 RepID=UPI002AD28982|nr:LOW QUALITY PROTEIN: protein NCBP2AS2 [Phyllopteryx taeniolatus]